MNLVNECTTKELKLLEEIGLNIENKEYSREELMMFKSYIEDFIMSHSIKSDEISVLSNQYSSILTTLVNFK